MSETYNIPRDSTLKDLVALQKAVLLGGSTDAGAIDRYYNGLVLAATTKTQVDTLFREWWATQYKEGTTTKAALLERWFGTVLDDTRVHGVKFPLFATSQSPNGELTDDSKGLVCTPSTAASPGNDPFAHLPQFWCLEVSAEKNADGSHTIYAVELIDDLNTVRSGEHLCWVLQKNTYTREYDEGGYRILKMQCHPAVGYAQWPEGKDRTGKIHAYIGHPKYAAGMLGGKITCGTGLAPVNYTSHNAGVSLWRQRGTQYSGASGDLPKFLLRMMWLKYARKGNSSTIEGCTTYNLQYAAAVSESNVKRIVLTSAQADAFFVGSSVIIGDKGDGSSLDRNVASMYKVAKNVRIVSIDPVSISGASYKALTVDVPATFNSVAGTTYVSSMPYWSGWNDDVLGNDGSKNSYTTGKEPGLLQKIEFQNGAYLIVSDELWQWGKNLDGDFTFDCYTCHNQTKVTTNGTISSDYTKQDDLTMVFGSGQGNEWVYIEDTAITKDPAVLWPKAVSKAAGSGTGVKAALYVLPAASGVRAAWVFGALHHGGDAGLPCRFSPYSATYANWYGALGAPGLAG